MCGFFYCYFRDKEIASRSVNFLKKDCSNYIANRGPSYQECLFELNTFAYQSVLSIQTQEKHTSINQFKNTESIFLYNGEIYNYDKEFHSSDTNYLISLWKSNSLEKELTHIDGMFAICFVEKLKSGGILLEAFRDYIGEKHLWYYLDNDVFMISSVPAVIRKYLSRNSKLEYNIEVLEDYLVRRHLINSNNHSIKGIKQILPGSKLSFDSDNWKINTYIVDNPLQYFEPNLYSYQKNKTNDALNEIYSNLLSNTLIEMEDATPRDSISASIMSGGIDSSLVSYFLLNENSERNIYTMLFKDKDNVSCVVPQLLNASNIDQKSLNLKQINCNTEIFKEALISSIDILSAPINTHSIPSSYLVAKNAKEDKNIILYGGEGADELFLGYSCYFDSRKQSVYNAMNSNFKFNIDLIERVQNGYNQIYINKFRFKVAEYLKDYLTGDELNIKVESFVDSFIQLNNVGLLSTDTINSDHGIECRTPFVRKPLIKYALSNPVRNLLINKDNKKLTKYPLNKLFKFYFKQFEVINKSGFAGYPNETIEFLGALNSWHVWDIFPWAKDSFIKLNRDEKWKLINIEWFLRVCF